MRKLLLTLILFITGCHYASMESFNNQIESNLPCVLQDENSYVGYLLITHEGYTMGGFWGHIDPAEDKLDCEKFVKNTNYWCKPIKQEIRMNCFGLK